MNFTRHVSAGEIEALLEDALPGTVGEEVRLHLSYCPLCLEQRNALSFREAVDRMRDAYERLSHSDREHIREGVFESFWRGEIKDTKHLERLSAHCIVCRKCHQKRQDVMLRLGADAVLRRRQLVAAVSLLVGIHRVRRAHAGALALLLLACIAAIFFSTRATLFPPGGSSKPTSAVDATRGGREGVSILNNHGDTPPAPTPLDSTPAAGVGKAQPTPFLLAQSRRPSGTKAVRPPAQSLSLKGLTEADEVRGVNSNRQVSYRTISPSRTGLTRLRIELPGVNTKGVYLVSLQEPAYLRALVGSKAASPDGKKLTVSLNLKEIPEGEYLLCITREGANPGEDEYIGHYRVYVRRQRAAPGVVKTTR